MIVILIATNDTEMLSACGEDNSRAGVTCRNAEQTERKGARHTEKEENNNDNPQFALVRTQQRPLDRASGGISMRQETLRQTKHEGEKCTSDNLLSRITW